MIPSRALLWLLAALVALGIASAWYAQLGFAWRVLAGGAAALCVIDALLALRERALIGRRHVAGSLPVGVASEVTLEFRNRVNRPIRFAAYDHHPADFAVTQMPATAEIKPGEWRTIRYSITPEHRGAQQFGRIAVHIRSPLILWWRSTRLGRACSVRVYPNFAAVSKYIQLATDHRLSDIGVRKLRRRGLGSEFHQLREYRQGDSLRQVDWRASARVRKLISREYQDERDQSVVFMMDCGRRMRAQDGALSHFDESLNAVLLLAYVALRQGDAVGVSTFGGSGRWLSPVKGKPMLNRLLNLLYDLQPGPELPDYSQAAQHLLTRQRKHSLVVIVTSIRDEDTDDLLPALHILRRRHVVLLASLREQSLDETLNSPVKGFGDAVRVAATHDYLAQRSKALSRLRNAGILCLDVNPRALSLELVNAYLAIKARGAM